MTVPSSCVPPCSNWIPRPANSWNSLCCSNFPIGRSA
jgi:hypothetical protein